MNNFIELTDQQKEEKLAYYKSLLRGGRDDLNFGCDYVHYDRIEPAEVCNTKCNECPKDCGAVCASYCTSVCNSVCSPDCSDCTNNCVGVCSSVCAIFCSSVTSNECTTVGATCHTVQCSSYTPGTNVLLTAARFYCASDATYANSNLYVEPNTGINNIRSSFGISSVTPVTKTVGNIATAADWNQARTDAGITYFTITGTTCATDCHTVSGSCYDVYNIYTSTSITANSDIPTATAGATIISTATQSWTNFSNLLSNDYCRTVCTSFCLNVCTTHCHTLCSNDCHNVCASNCVTQCGSYVLCGIDCHTICSSVTCTTY